MLLTFQFVLITTGALASLICSYFVSKSVYQYFHLNEPRKESERQGMDAVDRSLTFWKFVPELVGPSILPEWGSFRPGYYFGMKSRDSSLCTGMAWLDNSRERIRHEAQQDEIDQMDWIEHDGTNYGKQILIDRQSSVKIITSFVVPERNEATSPTWVQKIAVSSLRADNKLEYNFYYYFGLDCFQSDPTCLSKSALSNIKLLSAETKDRRNIFHMVGQNMRGQWMSFRILVNDLEAIESVSFQSSTDKNVFQGYQQLKRELTEFNRHRIPSKDKWFDDFGELKNHLPSTDRVRFTVLQLRIRKPVDIIITFDDQLSSAQLDKYSHDLIGNEQQYEEVVNDYTSLAQYYSKKFQSRFKSLVSFNSLKDFEDIHRTNNEKQQQIQVALSSLLGGIGFFEGNSRIEWNVDKNWETIFTSDPSFNQSNHQQIHLPVSTTDYTKLLSATPSRTIFPRGFLWDEGFHQLVIHHWNINITLSILSSWLDAMYIADYYQTSDSDTGKGSTEKIGWIPREMILGEDALQRVPEEFVTQRLNIANPPTFLLVIDSILKKYFREADSNSCQVSEESKDSCLLNEEERATYRRQILSFLFRIYPRLHYWIEWFRISQSGSNTTTSPTFRWRGRSIYDGKVVPNTLSSGLDDYPRGLYPVAEERHVDLLCWMIKSYQILDQIATLLQSHYSKTFQRLGSSSTSLSYQALSQSYLDSLYENHYSSEYHGFYDYGVNNESAIFLQEVLFRCGNPETKTAIEGYIPMYYLQNKQLQFCPASHPQPMYPMGDGHGGYLQRERVVADNFTFMVIPRIGYVSLFPFLLKLLPLSAEKEIDGILRMMEDPSLLYTDYGLRSMATTDRFYLKRNSPGDAPYWRGPIWININYLALSALHHYCQFPSAHQQRMKSLYQRLRNGILNNVLEQQKLTGFYWEQYDDQTGKGIRGHPFTGWTATIVNIFFEWY